MNNKWKKKAVGRPRSFDQDLVLRQVMNAFWTHGYDATTMQQLERATGLHKGSLYKAFGDKHDLFIAALTRYLDDVYRAKQAAIEMAPDPLTGLHDALAVMCVVEPVGEDDDTVGRSAAPDAEQGPATRYRGCFGLTSLMDRVPEDNVVEELLTANRDRELALFTTCIERGQNDGEISGRYPPAFMAQLLFTFLAGISATLKTPMPAAQPEELIDAFLQDWRA